MSHFGGRVVSGEEDEDDETPVSVSEIANSDNSLGLNDRVTPEVLDFKSQEAAALSSSTPLAVPPAAPPATTSVVISTPRIAVTPLLAQLQSANVEMQLQLSTFCASQLAASSIKVTFFLNKMILLEHISGYFFSFF